MKASWIQTQIRGLFAGLNYCVYSLVEFIMQGIFDIANLRLTEGLIGDIYKRIYVFLAIFMVFKLTISFLQYMVNPDKINDKEKGASKLIGRTITMLCLVLMLPNFFPLLNEAQTAFLPVLPKVILGTNNDNSSEVSSSAELLAATALSAFYSPCTACDESRRPSGITSIDDMMDTYDDKVSGIYQYDFNYIFALVVGIVIAIILVSITIKVGIRLFKMFILEMVAPIPIMSYMDPKSSKDGAFAAWTKQLLSTFLDIFVRLGVVYVVLLLLSALADGNLLDPASMPTNPVRKAYLMVFLIIALLMFAKDAPNFVKDAIGVKHDKDTSGFLAGAAGFATGGAAGAISGAISGRGIRGAITGFATGAATGFQGGMTGKKANAWSAAGDAALQARTGDSKAKSGMLAAMQASASKAQLHREGRKLGLTDATIESAKQNMLDMQALAGQAERNWQVGIQTGTFKDLDGNIISMEEASNLVAETSTASAIATKNYEKGNKAGDTYKLSRSFAEDYKRDRKLAKPDYRRGSITRDQYKAKGRFNPNKGRIDR